MCSIVFSSQTHNQKWYLPFCLLLHSKLDARFNAIQVAQKQLHQVTREGCECDIHIALPKVGRGVLTLSPQHPPLVGSQSLLKHRSHGHAMNMLGHLPSKLQKGCIEAQSQQVHNIIHTEVCSLQEGLVLLQPVTWNLHRQINWDTGNRDIMSKETIPSSSVRICLEMNSAKSFELRTCEVVCPTTGDSRSARSLHSLAA